MQLGREVGLGPSDIVLDGDPASHLQKKGAESPQFSAHVYCGQTAGWIKMAHGMEVGLCPCHIVLDGDPPPAEKGTAPPLFGPCLLWPRSPISATAEQPELLFKYYISIAMHCIGHENEIQSCRSIAQSVYSFAATHSQLQL